MRPQRWSSAIRWWTLKIDGRAEPSRSGSRGEDVAALYRHAELFTGPAATKAGVPACAGNHVIVHFAGHAIGTPASGTLAHICWPGPTRRAATCSRARSTAVISIDAARRPRRLSNHAGRIRRGEGVFSSRDRFSAAGVPIVVASPLGRRRSRQPQAAGRVSPPLRQGGSVTAALRGAQLDLMGDATRFFGVRPRGAGSP